MDKSMARFHSSPTENARYYANQLACFWVVIALGMVYCTVPILICGFELTQPPFWIELAFFAIGGILTVAALVWRLLYCLWRCRQRKPGRLADAILNT